MSKPLIALLVSVGVFAAGAIRLAHDTVGLTLIIAGALGAIISVEMFGAPTPKL